MESIHSTDELPLVETRGKYKTSNLLIYNTWEKSKGKRQRRHNLLLLQTDMCTEYAGL